MAEDKQITIFDEGQNTSYDEYKPSLEELQGELSKFSLTANQSKVYIFLGKYGSKTAPEVCKALKIARTETYHLLSTLQSKGIVSASFEHPIRFSALSLPKAMKTLVNAEKERVKILERKEKEIEKLWQDIPEFANGGKHDQEDRFQMLQGSNPINGKLSEMVSDAKTELLLIGSEKIHLKLYHSDIFSEISKKSVGVKILTSCNEKTEYVFEEISPEQKRVIPEKMGNEPCFIIKDGSELIFFTKNSPQNSQDMSAMWTDSKQMINSMKLLFEFIWKSSS